MADTVGSAVAVAVGLGVAAGTLATLVARPSRNASTAITATRATATTIPTARRRREPRTAGRRDSASLTPSGSRSINPCYEQGPRTRLSARARNPEGRLATPPPWSGPGWLDGRWTRPSGTGQGVRAEIGAARRPHARPVPPPAADVRALVISLPLSGRSRGAGSA